MGTSDDQKPVKPRSGGAEVPKRSAKVMLSAPKCENEVQK